MAPLEMARATGAGTILLQERSSQAKVLKRCCIFEVHRVGVIIRAFLTLLKPPELADARSLAQYFVCRALPLNPMLVKKS